MRRGSGVGPAAQHPLSQSIPLQLKRVDALGRAGIMGGTRLLRELLDSHHHDIPLVLAAYNAGPAAVARYGRVPPFRETRGYVKKIVTLIAAARDAGGD